MFFFCRKFTLMRAMINNVRICQVEHVAVSMLNLIHRKVLFGLDWVEMMRHIHPQSLTSAHHMQKFSIIAVIKCEYDYESRGWLKSDYRAMKCF